jgi:hypothetical protein
MTGLLVYTSNGTVLRREAHAPAGPQGRGKEPMNGEGRNVSAQGLVFCGVGSWDAQGSVAVDDHEREDHLLPLREWFACSDRGSLKRV